MNDEEEDINELGWAHFPAMGSKLLEVETSQLPSLITHAGDRAVRRFVEFFVVTIRNRNTRQAYAQAIGQFFCWCDARGLELLAIGPVSIAAYVEDLTTKR